MKITHCSECGSAYELLEWPRRCTECGAERWLSPSPVVALLQPVIGPSMPGLLIAQRAIEPSRGSWALVGGFMEPGESVLEAAMREFREETSLEPGGIPQIAFTIPVGRDLTQLMLMCYVDKAISFEVFQQGRPCSENQALGVLYPDSDIELAFPTHRDAAKRWFAGEYSWRH